MERTARASKSASQRQIRADSEATKAAVFAALALLVLGVGVALASMERLDAIGSVVLIVVAPIALSLAAGASARNALRNDTKHSRRAQFAAVVGALWEVLVH